MSCSASGNSWLSEPSCYRLTHNSGLQAGNESAKTLDLKIYNTSWSKTDRSSPLKNIEKQVPQCPHENLPRTSSCSWKENWCRNLSNEKNTLFTDSAQATVADSILRKLDHNFWITQQILQVALEPGRLAPAQPGFAQPCLAAIWSLSQEQLQVDFAVGLPLSMNLITLRMYEATMLLVKFTGLS